MTKTTFHRTPVLAGCRGIITLHHGSPLLAQEPRLPCVNNRQGFEFIQQRLASAGMRLVSLRKAYALTSTHIEFEATVETQFTADIKLPFSVQFPTELN